MPADKTKSSKWPYVVGVLIPILLVAGCNSLFNSADSKPSQGGKDALVKSACRTAVKQQLKNPMTAKFANEQVNGVRATGMVSGENALGGTVTYTYTCTTSGTGTNSGSATATLTKR